MPHPQSTEMVNSWLSFSICVTLIQALRQTNTHLSFGSFSLLLFHCVLLPPGFQQVDSNELPQVPSLHRDINHVQGLLVLISQWAQGGCPLSLGYGICIFSILWVVPAVIFCTHILLRKMCQGKLPHEANLKRNSGCKHVTCACHFETTVFKTSQNWGKKGSLLLGLVFPLHQGRCLQVWRRLQELTGTDSLLSAHQSPHFAIPINCATSHVKIEFLREFVIKAVSSLALWHVFETGSVWYSFASDWCDMENPSSGCTIDWVSHLLQHYWKEIPALGASSPASTSSEETPPPPSTMQSTISPFYQAILIPLPWSDEVLGSQRLQALPTVVRESGPYRANCLQAMSSSREKVLKHQKLPTWGWFPCRDQARMTYPWPSRTLYTLPSKERMLSFVSGDTAGLQRMGETWEGLEGKEAVETHQRAGELHSEMCSNSPQHTPALFLAWETFPKPLHLPEPLSIYKK